MDFHFPIPRLPSAQAQHFPPASGQFLAFPFVNNIKMFRTALPRVSRALPHNAPAAKRFLTTAPPHKTSRSWKNSAARWTLAGGLIYYYNTSTVFAEEPACTSSLVSIAPRKTTIIERTARADKSTSKTTDAIHSPPETSQTTPETYQTLDSIADQRRTQARSQAAASASAPAQPSPSSAAPELAPSDDPEQLEADASQQGAFNEETGEINWDCPCLGGMAHGPCGEQFREAFSCFVFSKDEPKGIDCIDKFKGMQDCFREHPEIYGAELEDDEEAPQGELEGQAIASPAQHEGGEKVSKPYGQDSKEVVNAKTERAAQAKEQVKRDSAPVSESETMVPKAWHSGVDADTEK
jgi:intermembrane space import and assembly protein 40